VKGLGVRSARSLFEPGEGLEEHERGGGGHFSPRLEGSGASQAPQLHSFAGSFLDQKPHGRSRQRGHRGRIHGATALILGQYGGEGKTASSSLRNQAGTAPNPFPGAAVLVSTQKKTFALQALTQNLDLAYAAK